MLELSPIKAAFAGCENIKNLFPNSNCAILVSIGQEKQEGDYFKSILTLVNNHFKECTIVVGDTLQRHNMRQEYPNSTQTYQLALAKGDSWIKRNQNIFSILTIPTTIKRWDTWLLQDGYKNNKERLLSYYYTNETYQQSIESTINDFMSRIYNRNDINQDIYAKNCFNYLIEELTILMLMMPENGFHYAIYPNRIPQAFQSTHDIFVKPIIPNIMNWVPVRFRKKQTQV